MDGPNTEKKNKYWEQVMARLKSGPIDTDSNTLAVHNWTPNGVMHAACDSHSSYDYRHVMRAEGYAVAHFFAHMAGL